MNHKTKIIMLVTAILMICFLATGLAVQQSTMARGYKSLYALAKEGGFCKTDHCEDGVSYATNYLGREFSLSPRLVQWCMGVNSIAHENSNTASQMKVLFTNILYIPCGDPRNDTSAE